MPVLNNACARLFPCCMPGRPEQAPAGANARLGPKVDTPVDRLEGPLDSGGPPSFGAPLKKYPSTGQLVVPTLPAQKPVP